MIVESHGQRLDPRLELEVELGHRPSRSCLLHRRDLVHDADAQAADPHLVALHEAARAGTSAVRPVGRHPRQARRSRCRRGTPRPRSRAWSRPRRAPGSRRSRSRRAAGSLPASRAGSRAPPGRDRPARRAAGLRPRACRPSAALVVRCLPRRAADCDVTPLLGAAAGARIRAAPCPGPRPARIFSSAVRGLRARDALAPLAPLMKFARAGRVDDRRLRVAAGQQRRAQVVAEFVVPVDRHRDVVDRGPSGT